MWASPPAAHAVSQPNDGFNYQNYSISSNDMLLSTSRSGNDLVEAIVHGCDGLQALGGSRRKTHSVSEHISGPADHVENSTESQQPNSKSLALNGKVYKP